ncbi:MAG: HutP family protein [Caldisericia bacterium]|nr:HutP family protein [Caldisericia bacterium]
MKLERIGKIAMLAALSDDEEEKVIKEKAVKIGIKLAVTVVAGLASNVKEHFVKSIIGCAIQNNIVEKNSVLIHGVVHASLDALQGILHQVPVDASIRMKVGIASDGHWIAVALYGDSAFYPLTNHERGSLSIMHLTK